MTKLIARAFVEATTDQQRAAALLIIPHALLLHENTQAAINATAIKTEFWMARDYVDAVVSAASPCAPPRAACPKRLPQGCNASGECW